MDWIICQSVLSGEAEGEEEKGEEEEEKSIFSSGVWCVIYVALSIYSYELFCSSSGEGIHEHINMDCRKLLKEGFCLQRR